MTAENPLHDDGVKGGVDGGCDGPLRIVVIGGGFAGLDCVRATLSLLQRRCFEVVLMDKTDYHSYVPDVPSLLVSPSLLDKVTRRFDSLSSHSHFRFIQVSSVKLVSLKSLWYDGSHNSATISFDYLIVCTGMTYDSPIRSVGNWSDRAEFLVAYESRLSKCNDEGDPGTVLIMGGGHVGVEVVGELCHKYKNIRIIFATGSSGLLGTTMGVAKSQRAYALAFFAKFPNVRLFEERALKVDKEDPPSSLTPTSSNRYRLIKGDFEFSADVVISCTGFGRPNTSFLEDTSVALTEKRHVKCDARTLQAQGTDGKNLPNIFCAGDVREKSPKQRLASFAHFEGEFCARQVVRSVQGKSLRAFSTPADNSFALGLGKHDGFLVIFGRMCLWGRVVPLAKWIVRMGWIHVVPLLPALPLWLDSRLDKE